MAAWTRRGDRVEIRLTVLSTVVLGIRTNYALDWQLRYPQFVLRYHTTTAAIKLQSSSSRLP